MSKRPVAVDLFSGVGGMALGFEQAGFDVVAAVERDPSHAAAHSFNFPNCRVLQADALQVAGSDVADAVREGLRRHGRAVAEQPHVDVVFGGPPCQGFSVGGLLDPTDTRNLLVREFVRLVETIRPTAFVLENVPAMASRVLPGCRLPVPEWLKARLGKAGYEIAAPKVLNASHFGVPQDRRRLLIMGVLQGIPIPAYPRSIVAAQRRRPDASPRPGEIGHPSTDPELPAGPTVRDAIGELPDIERFDELMVSDSVALRSEDVLIAKALRSSYAAHLAGDQRHADDLSAPRIFDPSLLTASMRTHHAAGVRARFASTPQGAAEPVSRLYRLHPDGLSRTLRAGSGPDRGSYSAPRPIHPHANRVISVREAARLHGFPDWFRFTAAKWHGFRQVGNAVPPPLAREIAKVLRDAIGAPAIPSHRPIVVGDLRLLHVSNGGGRTRPAKAAQTQDVAASHVEDVLAD